MDDLDLAKIPNAYNCGGNRLEASALLWMLGNFRNQPMSGIDVRVFPDHIRFVEMAGRRDYQVLGVIFNFSNGGTS